MLSFFNSKVGNGYGCTHPEQEDLSEKTIDWDGLCECGEVTEGEYLLVDVGNEATDDQKNALYSYERYIHRYDKKWLDAHNIPNSLVE